MDVNKEGLDSLGLLDAEDLALLRKVRSTLDTKEVRQMLNADEERATRLLNAGFIVKGFSNKRYEVCSLLAALPHDGLSRSEGIIVQQANSELDELAKLGDALKFERKKLILPGAGAVERYDIRVLFNRMKLDANGDISYSIKVFLRATVTGVDEVKFLKENEFQKDKGYYTRVYSGKKLIVNFNPEYPNPQSYRDFVIGSIMHRSVLTKQRFKDRGGTRQIIEEIKKDFKAAVNKVNASAEESMKLVNRLCLGTETLPTQRKAPKDKEEVKEELVDELGRNTYIEVMERGRRR